MVQELSVETQSLLTPKQSKSEAKPGLRNKEMMTKIRQFVSKIWDQEEIK